MTKKILLALLPFWTPLIPPLGISCLKRSLQEHGFQVKTVDANVEAEFKEINERYFQVLEGALPPDKRQHLRNIGYKVLCSHLMAHMNRNRSHETQYLEVIRMLVNRTFFHTLADNRARELKIIVEEFYTQLEAYILNLLQEVTPEVLGLSVYSDTLAPSLFTFKLAKKMYPHIRTVMGGGVFAGDLAIGSPDFDFFLEKTPYIDKIIVGEGEHLFLKWLHQELPSHQRVYTLQDIGSQVLDLQTAGVPDFSDLSIDYYPSLSTYASRSCPFRCSFCSEVMLWGKYRKKPTKQIIDEFIHLYQTYGIQLFLMCDSLLNPLIIDVSRELADSEIPIYWDGYLRVDKVACNAGNTMKWRQAGFYRARLGIESGSQHVLNMMDKKITIEQIKETLFNLASAGIKTTTYWVIGYPGETESDFLQSLRLIEELKDEIYEIDCNPFTYFLTGQVSSDQWIRQGKYTPLYPENTVDMLMLRSWYLEGKPSREEVFQRLNRFVQHCRQLDIPNPYTLQEIYQADDRWKRLHNNAVPPLVEFMAARGNKANPIDDRKTVQKKVCGRNIYTEDGNWGF